VHATRLLLALVLATSGASAAFGAGFVVRNAGSGGDSNTADNVCSTATPANANTCTLRAAIQQGNALAGPHTITFDAGVQTITLGASLPQVTSRTTFDGTNASNTASGGRVVIDGAATNGCFDLRESTTAVSPNGARGSTIRNFVVRRCQGAGIALSGHGYTITGNRVGTDPAGSAASGPADANGAAGITVSGTVAPPPAAPNLSSLLSDPPQTYGAILAFAEGIKGVLSAVASPTVISGNVVSGNNGDGITLFGQSTFNTFILGNLIGVSADGLSRVPNGRGPGNKDGIRLEGTAWGNFIGPGNLISGNNGSGVAMQSGAVLLPNFVAGNLIGLGSAPTDVGNAENGISVDTFPKSSGPGANNPTGYAAFIGPANTISDNRSDAGGAGIDVVSADTSGGLLVAGASSGIEVFANVVGLATFPAGATPLGQLQYGNSGNGMVITVPDVRISRNIILANGRHGILLRGSGTVRTRILGNFIGVSVPTGLSPLVGLGNTGDGIHVFSAGSSQIGGPGGSDRNVIAGNGRNGIALRNGSATSGWANLIQRNAIYGNARGGTGIGIDLERVANASDDFNPNALPENYANFDQLAPILCGGSPLPAECNGGAGPSYGGAGTALRWTLPLRPQSPSRPMRIEFYTQPPDGSGQTFLGEQLVTVDTTGRPTGAGCVNGLCSATLGGATDSSGQSLVATATDLRDADVPPTGNQPPQPLSPSNNTSEFSAPVTVRRALEITTPAPLPPGTTQQPYALTFQAVGGSGVFSAWTVAAGTPPNGLALGATNGQLAGTPTAAGTSNFSIRVTDSEGSAAVAAYAITVATQPPPVITTPSPLPGATVGAAYSVTLQAAGGSGGFTGWGVVLGSLPDGLSLGSTTGTISGTPTLAGSHEFTVQVADGNDNLATRGYTLVVQPAAVPLSITTTSPLPAATEDADYNVALAAAGGSGSYSGWSIVSGLLPSGVSINAGTGVLSGRPGAAGAFGFTVRVMDSLGGVATRAFTLDVAPAPATPPSPSYTITPASIDFGMVRVGTSVTVPIVVRNISRLPFNPDIDITGSAAQLLASPFLSSDGTCNSTLAAGASCTLNVTFRPRRGGDLASSGNARVTTPLVGSIVLNLGDIPLRGTGSGRLVDLAPTSIDFGTQQTGSLTTVGIGITNPTSSRLRISGGAPTSTTGFVGPVSGCGATIDPGVTCTISYRFAPAVPGAFQSGARIGFAQDSGLLLPQFSDQFDIALSGIGIDVAQATSTRPVALDFGGVQVGRSATLLVTTQNLSAAGVTVTGGDFPAADATTWVRGPACASPTAPGASCLLDFSFLPRENADYAINTALTITQGAQSRQVALSLSGTGTGTLAQVSPMQLDLGRVPVNGSNSGQVSVVNGSEVTLAVTRFLATPFDVTSTCGATLAPGASCTVTYRLDGDVALVGFQSADARIRLANDAGGYLQVATIALTGEVVDAIFDDGFE
jgi:hypothetical protein